jgi:hypothetical protein
MILEGIVTTENADGSVNISPMGPAVDPDMRQLLLKPYTTSTTYQNLKRTRQGVFHVTDDVELIAHTAVAAPALHVELIDVSGVQGKVLAGACRWYAFQVDKLDDARERTEIACTVTSMGRLRDFFGFNRAKHAVLEAAILATRTQFLPPDRVLAQLGELAPLVEKTGGAAEKRAFAFLRSYVEKQYAGEPRVPSACDLL